MSVQLLREEQPQNSTIEEEIQLPPTDLPYDDGEPLESNRHRIAMNVLIDSIHQVYQEREDYFAGGNMFIYYSSEQVRNRDFRGPDFFVVLNVDGTLERRSWMVWEERGRYPDVIVELMSASTASEDTGNKKRIYEQTFRTQDYFVYDPFDRESLQGWHLERNQRYEAIAPDERGWLWCESLGLWLGTWDGTLTRENAPWLRFYDRDGNLVLLPAEIAQQEREIAQQEREIAQQEREIAQQERERADRLARLLQENGIDPDRM
ncbi:MAG: Uma2 family endonuclease [Cyanobacteria bacterium SBLK]|nr:Uma2 family endonuclease [Cyanobacteria bacterium SBLK]